MEWRIVTDNFDNLMGEAVDARGVPRVAYAMRGSEIAGDPNEIAKNDPTWHVPILHLHDYTPRKLLRITHVRYVFSTAQYEVVYGGPRVGILKRAFEECLAKPIHLALYVGCSFADEEMNNLLREAAEMLPGRRHFALLKWPEKNSDPLEAPASQRAQHEARYHSMGIQPIWFKKFTETPGLLSGLRGGGRSEQLMTKSLRQPNEALHWTGIPQVRYREASMPIQRDKSTQRRETMADVRVTTVKGTDSVLKDTAWDSIPKGGHTMAWNMTAEFIETCSCNMLCPCWYGVRELMVMDQGWCASTWLLRVQHGTSDGVDLGGRTLAMALDFPGPTLYDGNGTARIYIDDGASADQRRELEAIFQGTKGGPMAIVGGLVTKWLPTRTAQMDIQEQDGNVTATIAGFGQVKSQRLTNEVGQPTTMQNTGFTTALQFDNQAAQLAPSAGTEWSDPDMPRQFETKSGAVATFTWSVS